MSKENFEWLRSWCDNTGNKDLPRVLLVGDSITDGYNEMVRESLRGVCYVDHMATSYSVDNNIYGTLCKEFFNNSHYDVIHFNHGLHGKGMSRETYKEGLRIILADRKEKIVITTSTVVKEKDSEKIDESWLLKLSERNCAVKELADEYGYFVDDLFSVSLEIPDENRNPDGYHYKKEGYARLAESVVSSIKKALNNK